MRFREHVDLNPDVITKVNLFLCAVGVHRRDEVLFSKISHACIVLFAAEVGTECVVGTEKSLAAILRRDKSSAI